MTTKGCGGRASDPSRRHEESAAKLNTLGLDGNASDGELTSDALFGVRSGAYSSAFTMPGEDPVPEAVIRRNEGMLRASRVEDYGAPVRIRQWAQALEPGTRVTAEHARVVPGADVLADNAWGSVFAGLVRDRVLRKIGYKQATRPESHGRVIAEYIRTAS